ncbi:MAG TPA: ATP-binding cassette domain-containing protein [Candidatus Limnocylindrales bacterium]|nr:ATP-binding cassette domain-containing protein [Candidatus Limnocylindrales bacterium]
MATAVRDPTEPSGSKRRRRRARRDARAAVAQNGAGAALELQAPVLTAAVEAAEPVVAIEPEPAPAIQPEPVPAIQPEPQAAIEPEPQAVDEFRDLLGQAVGLRLDSVSREFGGRHEMHVAALRNVTLDVGPCEFVAIVGPSGCGKSTLLSLMGGLDRPTTGHVYGAGLPLGELSDRDLSDYRLQRVSTIFQTFNLIHSMTAEDNVALPLTLAGVELEERRKRARHLLALVGLENRARTRAGRLSGGEQQKVAVARALANRPGLILADEPTGSLDSAAGESVLALLDDLNRRGATVVLVTHDPEVARHARRVVRMIDGRAIELESGKATVRSQEPVDPPARMHWKDTLKVGLGSAGRRPLRTALTTLGVAIGIAALSLIGALAGGLQQALDAPALATSQVHQVAVYPVADARTPAFDAATLATLARLSHVRAAWGQVGMTGSFTASGGSQLGTTNKGAQAPGQLVSLPPLASSSNLPALSAGRLPSSDLSTEVLLTDSEAVALGFRSPPGAVGTQVKFSATSGALVPSSTTNQVTQPVSMTFLVVGIVSTDYMPAGAPGALAPNGVMRAYWTTLAGPNNWKGGEYSSITLLADSGLAVTRVRENVRALGFQTQTFGDQFRNFEELLGKLRVALLGLAIVALLLACLGIANTMYTAVLERTKEIGVLKALGARSRDVLLLFLAEATGIGLAGGLVGAVVAVGLARLGNAAVDRLIQSVTSAGFDVFRTDFLVVVVAVIIAVVLSTVSGLLPALRAARQDPSRALRYE